MPAARMRTSNPQGRQKSCSECAKAKRKCGMQVPHCLRCTKQRLTCTYPPQPRASGTLTPREPDDPPLFDDLFGDPPMELLFDLNVASVPATSDVEFLDPIPPDLTGPMRSSEEANNTLQTFGGGTAMYMPSRIDGVPFAKGFADMVVSELFESRVGYSMEAWKSAPRMMVEETCTPWCHRNLYGEQMPRSMQDAFSACSLYIARTEWNAKFVWRHIIERAHELAEQPTPTIPAELIARAHALLLYQIMIISSGDYRYYSQGQTLLPHLRDLSNTLFTLAAQDQTKSEDQAEPLPLYPSSIARAAWRSFVFRETVRRTFLALCHAVSICTLLQGEIIECNHGLAAGNRFTLSAALWEAKSPLEFAVAWKERNHYLVKDLDFTEVLRSADASDVDVFGRMIMVGIMGADDVKGWLHSRGGKL